MDGDELWNEKTLTGIKVPSSEQKAAIYLGFTHICRFRAYLSSRLFLQLYWNQTNRYLKLAYDNDFLSEDCPVALEALMEKYPTQTSMHGDDDDPAAPMYPGLQVSCVRQYIIARLLMRLSNARSKQPLTRCRP